MGLLDILFPKRCIQCKKIGEYVCTKCFAQLSYDVMNICLVCNGWSIDGLTHPRCMGKYTIDGAFCGLVYNRVMKRLLYVFKYQPYVADLGKFLTNLLYEGLIQQEYFIKISQKYSPVFIPIPLSSNRLKKRGYNQSEILAKELANFLYTSMINCFERTVDTKPQFGLKREERRVNIKGAFEIKKWEVRSENVEKEVGNGKHRSLTSHLQIQLLTSNLSFPSAFLVDDLLTTGTTLLEAANVLKRNGFKKVWGVCLARDQ